MHRAFLKTARPMKVFENSLLKWTRALEDSKSENEKLEADVEKVRAHALTFQRTVQNWRIEYFH